MDIELHSTPNTNSSAQVEPTEFQKGAGQNSLSGLLATTDYKANNDDKVVEKLNNRMVRIFFWGFVCAFVYVIFPVVNKEHDTNYWAYYLAKEQFWSFFGNAGFVEMYEACLPGTPDYIYVYSYIFGWMVPPVMHIIAYYTGAATNSTLGILAVTTSLILTTALYGYHQIMSLSTQSDIRQSIAEEGTTFDMFSQVMDITDRDSVIYEEGRNSSEVYLRSDSLVVNTTAGKPLISSFRAGWLRYQTIQQQEQISNSKNENMIQNVENPLNSSARDGDNTDVKPQTVLYTNEHYAENEYPEGWFQGIPNYCKRFQLMPKFAFPFKSKTAITTKNKLFHFLCTFLFNFGWVLVYFILVVRVRANYSFYICLHEYNI